MFNDIEKKSKPYEEGTTLYKWNTKDKKYEISYVRLH